MQVFALAHRASALGFRSRYAVGAVCPTRSRTRPGTSPSWESLRRALDAPAPIFPTHDEFLNAIARHADELGGRFLCPFPDWELLEKIQDKAWQLAQAERLGIPVPRTVEEPVDDLVFPVLVKPRDPVGFRREFGRQAFRCESPEALAADFERARPHRPLVQEFVPGGDEELYSLGSYLDAGGEALGLFSRAEAAADAPGVGTCRIGEAVWVDEVVEQGLALLRGIGFRGLSQVEFKRDARDGRYKLMEINPRLWQWHGLAAAARGRPHPHRLPRPDRAAAGAGAHERAAAALGDHACARRAARLRAAAVRGRRPRPRRPPARAHNLARVARRVVA